MGSTRLIIGNNQFQFIPAGPPGPPGVGIPGEPGPESQMASAGMLADLPIAAAVRNGYQYYATDAKSLYVKVGDLGLGSWEQVALTQSSDLELVMPASTGAPVTLTSPATPYQLPGFETGELEYDGSPVQVSTFNLSVKGSHSVSSSMVATLAFKKNGGPTLYPIGVGVERAFTNLTGFGMGYNTAFDNAIGVLPNVSASLSPGDMFSVHVLISRTGGSSGTVEAFVGSALGSIPGLLVKRLSLG